MIPRLRLTRLAFLVSLPPLLLALATEFTADTDRINIFLQNAALNQEPLVPHPLGIGELGHNGEIGAMDKDGDVPILPGTIPSLLEALEVMQSCFFQIWPGTWPDAIDWTAAVMGTQISASLNAITRSKPYDTISTNTLNFFPLEKAAFRENLVNHYFTQLVSFYYGEDAFAVRGQAYDDMLWVVLGWLESIKMINTHSNLHFGSGEGDNLTSVWYAKQFIPAFAHRARIFYELASDGWDTTLCGGGMIWNPYLAPYKNAITNQLYIAASINMYLHFPGDLDDSPFVSGRGEGTRDEKYLNAAVEAYRWLAGSNMTNIKGLFVDGYHIHGWRGGRNGSTGTEKCDIRDEKVYTYNQGVLLSGLRGLWEATGAENYLKDGHKLIHNVIAATGWYTQDVEARRRWGGIGRNGILEEACDASASCNQDGQTFKGIFFHHMTVFCAPLPIGRTNNVLFAANKALANLHRQSCREYGPWLKHNAQAAYNTRDSKGIFGMWWSWGLWRDHQPLDEVDYEVPDAGTDYRNRGVPNDSIWQKVYNETDAAAQMPSALLDTYETRALANPNNWCDPNDRGRGRTVETQSGGVAILRALHSLVNMDEGS